MIDYKERQMVCDSCGAVNDMSSLCWSMGACKCYKCGHKEEFEPESEFYKEQREKRNNAKRS